MKSLCSSRLGKSKPQKAQSDPDVGHFKFIEFGQMKYERKSMIIKNTPAGSNDLSQANDDSVSSQYDDIRESKHDSVISNTNLNISDSRVFFGDEEPCGKTCYIKFELGI